MEKKRYIKPRSVVIDDAGVSLMEASPWREKEVSVTSVDAKRTYEDGIDYEIGYITTDQDASNYTPNAKMHDLWEEW